MIIARYDVILDQSERARLYNHLSNYTKIKYGMCYANNIIYESLVTFFSFSFVDLSWLWAHHRSLRLQVKKSAFLVL